MPPEHAAVPGNLQPYFDKGIQAYTQGSYAYAIDLFTFIIAQAPDATEARRYLRLAIRKHAQESPPGWLTQAGLLLISWPLRVWVVLLSWQGHHRRAIQHFEGLLRLQPRSAWLLLHLADSLHRAELDDAALATYEELLALHPNHLAALRQMAKLSMARGHDMQARRCFERVLTLVPNDLEAQQSLRNLDALGTIKKGFSA